MIVATTPYISGHRVTETKGQAFGLVVRSRGMAGNLAAGLRSIVGGASYTYGASLSDEETIAAQLHLVSGMPTYAVSRYLLDGTVVPDDVAGFLAPLPVERSIEFSACVDGAHVSYWVHDKERDA